MAVSELKSYPFPEGMAIPRLMPFQQYPWNGDHFLAAEVFRLKEAHGLTFAVETGTCLGSTTCWLAENFTGVFTGEINDAFQTIASRRFALIGVRNITGYDSSADVLKYGLRSDCFVFLDAHWGPNCPLLDELDTIARAGVKPCIVIHDFYVPGTDFGFDRMPDGRAFDLELITPSLLRIYGEGGYKYNYPTQVAGAKRGWISIEPC